ncbi:hypothetical protein LINGRAHAP2_LOCUS35027 [Linum grandiflorum]
MASVHFLSPPTTTTSSTAAARTPSSLHLSKIPFPLRQISTTRINVSSPANKSTSTSSKPSKSSSSPRKPPPKEEVIYFDGGAHYGDLAANLLLGFTLFWLPLTLAAVSRAFNLRYRFTNLRVTVISGLTGQDRSDFSYKVIKDVQVVPRFIGEWGDVIITLRDGTIVDLRSVPRFREIANYCRSMIEEPAAAAAAAVATESRRAKGF